VAVVRKNEKSVNARTDETRGDDLARGDRALRG
jgi:hypothetical protein